MIKNSAIQGIMIILVVTVLFGLSSCSEKSKPTVTTPRDTTITIENAYSQLFMDSTALENFIAIEITSDSIANYMRNFYKSHSKMLR